MKIIRVKTLKEIKTDIEIVFITKNSKLPKIMDILNFKADSGDSQLLIESNKLYISIKNITSHQEYRANTAKAIRELRSLKIEKISLDLMECKNDKIISAIIEGIELGIYSFDKYKSKKNPISLKECYIASKHNIDTLIKKAQIITSSVNFTRDIVNSMPDEMHPKEMAKVAKNMARECGLNIKIEDENFLAKNGMNAFLAVARASYHPPRLVHITHKPSKPKAKVVVVGKGLTYDSGGLSLKPGNAMETMKLDKSGASAVLGILRAVKKLNLPIEVHGVCGLAENMIGGDAYKPDDILVAKNGKTIEVKNTDAEGRLVLADCLCYASELKPDYIIDIATLTGACVVALGPYTTGVMGFGNKMKHEIYQAGNDSGELVGGLPFNDYLKDLLKSDIADISNIGGRYGGAVTAGLFLSEFVDKKLHKNWIHLDIAGPAYSSKAWGENPIGASGAGVRLILEWLSNL